MNEERNTQEKDIQFYAASVTAWFNTRLEHDKSLLALSAGGIGLLVTLLTTVGVKSIESFNGASKLRKENDIGKSFAGAGKLKPEVPQDNSGKDTTSTQDNNQNNEKTKKIKIKNE